MWKSNYEGDSQIVVFTFTERSCSIAMARDGLLLTYLCNRVDSEANEQVIAARLSFCRIAQMGLALLSCNRSSKTEKALSRSKWSDGLVRCERTYPAQDPPEYHLLPDLAWHTIDERMVRSSATEIDREKLASNSSLVSCRNRSNCNRDSIKATRKDCLWRKPLGVFFSYWTIESGRA